VAKKKRTLPILNGSACLIDTHCHLDMAAYSPDLEAVLENAYSHGVKSVITIGIDPTSSRAAVALAYKYSMIKATVGIHPHDVGNITSGDLDDLQQLIDSGREKIVGYGEIGLDYVKRYCDPDLQRRSFQDQLLIAKNHKLPIIVHDREAHDDILAILQKNGPYDNGGVMHCFSGDYAFAMKVLDLGFSISIPGIVTFKNAASLQETAQKIPLESLLLETDGPFLAPEPYRGKRNESLYLLYTADQVARLRGITLEEVAVATTSNASRLFNIAIPMENDR
jgi:TatD DNase family protein